MLLNPVSVEEKKDIIYSLKNNEVERQPFFSFLGDSVSAAGKLVIKSSSHLLLVL